MEHRLHIHTPEGKRDHDFGMAVHNALRLWKRLQDLPVDEALRVALRRVFVRGRRVVHVVGDEVVAGFYERGGAGIVGGEEVLGGVEGVTHGDVAEGVDEGVVVQDVGGGN